MSLVDTCSCGAPLSMLPKDHLCGVNPARDAALRHMQSATPYARDDAADAIVSEIMAYCQISLSDASELAQIILTKTGLATGGKVEGRSVHPAAAMQSEAFLPHSVSLELKLKPCPFCGGEAAFEQIGSRVLTEGCAWSVGCENEQCLGFQSVTTYARKAEAASAWNTRPADAIAALSEDNARLRRVLEPFAAQRTIDEIMQNPTSSEWADAPAERRIEMMGERKRQNTENILRARAALAARTALQHEGSEHDAG